MYVNFKYQSFEIQFVHHYGSGSTLTTNYFFCSFLPKIVICVSAISLLHRWQLTWSVTKKKMVTFFGTLCFLKIGRVKINERVFKGTLDNVKQVFLSILKLKSLDISKRNDFSFTLLIIYILYRFWYVRKRK